MTAAADVCCRIRKTKRGGVDDVETAGREMT
jgi:hypothetical protein